MFSQKKLQEIIQENTKVLEDEIVLTRLMGECEASLNTLKEEQENIGDREKDQAKRAEVARKIKQAESTLGMIKAKLEAIAAEAAAEQAIEPDSMEREIKAKCERVEKLQVSSEYWMSTIGSKRYEEKLNKEKSALAKLAARRDQKKAEQNGDVVALAKAELDMLEAEHLEIDKSMQKENARQKAKAINNARFRFEILQIEQKIEDAEYKVNSLIAPGLTVGSSKDKGVKRPDRAERKATSELAVLKAQRDRKIAEQQQDHIGMLQADLAELLGKKIGCNPETKINRLKKLNKQIKEIEVACEIFTDYNVTTTYMTAEEAKKVVSDMTARNMRNILDAVKENPVVKTAYDNWLKAKVACLELESQNDSKLLQTVTKEELTQRKQLETAVSEYGKLKKKRPTVIRGTSNQADLAHESVASSSQHDGKKSEIKTIKKALKKLQAECQILEESETIKQELYQHEIQFIDKLYELSKARKALQAAELTSDKVKVLKAKIEVLNKEFLFIDEQDEEKQAKQAAEVVQLLEELRETKQQVKQQEKINPIQKQLGMAELVKELKEALEGIDGNYTQTVNQESNNPDMLKDELSQQAIALLEEYGGKLRQRKIELDREKRLKDMQYQLKKLTEELSEVHEKHAHEQGINEGELAQDAIVTIQGFMQRYKGDTLPQSLHVDGAYQHSESGQIVEMAGGTGGSLHHTSKQGDEDFLKIPFEDREYESNEELFDAESVLEFEYDHQGSLSENDSQFEWPTGFDTRFVPESDNEEEQPLGISFEGEGYESSGGFSPAKEVVEYGYGSSSGSDSNSEISEARNRQDKLKACMQRDALLGDVQSVIIHMGEIIQAVAKVRIENQDEIAFHPTTDKSNEYEYKLLAKVLGFFEPSRSDKDNQYPDSLPQALHSVEDKALSSIEALSYSQQLLYWLSKEFVANMVELQYFLSRMDSKQVGRTDIKTETENNTVRDIDIKLSELRELLFVIQYQQRASKLSDKKIKSFDSQVEQVVNLITRIQSGIFRFNYGLNRFNPTVYSTAFTTDYTKAYFQKVLHDIAAWHSFSNLDKHIHGHDVPESLEQIDRYFQEAEPAKFSGFNVFSYNTQLARDKALVYLKAKHHASNLLNALEDIAALSVKGDIKPSQMRKNLFELRRLYEQHMRGLRINIPDLAKRFMANKEADGLCAKIKAMDSIILYLSLSKGHIGYELSCFDMNDSDADNSDSDDSQFLIVPREFKQLSMRASHRAQAFYDELESAIKTKVLVSLQAIYDELDGLPFEETGTNQVHLDNVWQQYEGDGFRLINVMTEVVMARLVRQVEMVIKALSDKEDIEEIFALRTKLADYEARMVLALTIPAQNKKYHEHDNYKRLVAKIEEVRESISAECTKMDKLLQQHLPWWQALPLMVSMLDIISIHANEKFKDYFASLRSGMIKLQLALQNPTLPECYLSCISRIRNTLLVYGFLEFDVNADTSLEVTEAVGRRVQSIISPQAILNMIDVIQRSGYYDFLSGDSISHAMRLLKNLEDTIRDVVPPDFGDIGTWHEQNPPVLGPYVTQQKRKKLEQQVMNTKARKCISQLYSGLHTFSITQNSLTDLRRKHQACISLFKALQGLKEVRELAPKRLSWGDCKTLLDVLAFLTPLEQLLHEKVESYLLYLAPDVLHPIPKQDGDVLQTLAKYCAEGAHKMANGGIKTNRDQLALLGEVFNSGAAQLGQDPDKIEGVVAVRLNSLMNDIKSAVDYVEKNDTDDSGESKKTSFSDAQARLNQSLGWFTAVAHGVEIQEGNDLVIQLGALAVRTLLLSTEKGRNIIALFQKMTEDYARACVGETLFNAECYSSFDKLLGHLKSLEDTFAKDDTKHWQTELWDMQEGASIGDCLSAYANCHTKCRDIRRTFKEDAEGITSKQWQYAFLMLVKTDLLYAQYHLRYYFNSDAASGKSYWYEQHLLWETYIRGFIIIKSECEEAWQQIQHQPGSKALKPLWLDFQKMTDDIIQTLKPHLFMWHLQEQTSALEQRPSDKPRVPGLFNRLGVWRGNQGSSKQEESKKTAIISDAESDGKNNGSNRKVDAREARRRSRKSKKEDGIVNEPGSERKKGTANNKK